MPLTVASRLEEDIGILELSGTLTTGPWLVDVRNKARQLLDGQKLKGLIAHVGAVTKTDTSGLGELTAVYSFASKQGCPIRLVAVRPDLRKVLELTRLDGILPSAADIAAAKRDFKRNDPNAASMSA
jgi:anti-anti-sigma factor